MGLYKAPLLSGDERANFINGYTYSIYGGFLKEALGWLKALVFKII